MNLLDQINLQVQQQAVHELADQLHLGYHHDPCADYDSEICMDENLLRTIIQQLTSRQAAAFNLNERRWLEECHEWI